MWLLYAVFNVVVNFVVIVAHIDANLVMLLFCFYSVVMLCCYVVVVMLMLLCYYFHIMLLLSLSTLSEQAVMT